MFNRLIRLRNLVREGWSGIDVQLKRRSDLVPNLVATVKAYAAHERSVLEEVTASRQSSIAADDVSAQASAEQGPAGRARQLFAVAEAYPRAQGRQEFPRPAAATGRDRGSAADGAPLLQRHGAQPEYRIQSFPANVLAGVLGFRELPFFELEDRAQAAVPAVAFQAPQPCANRW